MKILVIGQSGQLGSELLLSKQEKFEFINANSKDIMLSDENQLKLFVDSNNPKVVINCVAWTDVDSAETNKESAMFVNAEIPLHIANVCKIFSIPFYHISTDYVFSGNRIKPWEVSDIRLPISTYGKSKAIGEDNTLLVYGEGTRIFRTAWLYSSHRKNFVKTIIKNALKNNNQIRVVKDQIGQPTSATDLAKFLLLCIDEDLPAGIYHTTNAGQATWYEFAREIFMLVGKNPDRVIPIQSIELNQKAPRPEYSVLSHACWEDTELDPLRNWRDALREQIEDIKQAVISEGL